MKQQSIAQKMLGLKQARQVEAAAEGREFHK